MELVRIISTDNILPATYSPDSTPQRVDLTPWDIQFLLFGPIQKGLLFDHSAPDTVHLLKTSLSRTLDNFYPLAGRLRWDEDLDRDAQLYYVECNNQGVEFVEAVSQDITVADILEPEYDAEIIQSLFPQNGLLNMECDVKPFFAVQVTELAGGGRFIGCTSSHLFADGTSFWHFLNSWSEICRGFDCLSNPPVLDRQHPSQSKVWIPNASIIHIKKPADYNPTILKERIFHLSKEKIASLKLNAIVETGNPKISSLQAVLAHVWQSVSRSQGLDANDGVHFIIAIGDRTRTEPALHTRYFGNAVHYVKGSLKCKEILAEDGLGRAASHLNELISQQTGLVVLDFIRSWSDKPPLISPIYDTSTNSLTLATSSSPKFDVYGNDFGWGRPVTVRSGSANKGAGKITIFCGEEGGSMDIGICLLAETLEALKKDTEFVSSGY